MQLHVFADVQGEPDHEAQARQAIIDADIPAVLYRDWSHPDRLAVLTWSEDAAFFAHRGRSFFHGAPWHDLTLEPQMTMAGRTYLIGYERDPEHDLLRKPIEVATDPDWPWVVWYPLRRAGSFESLDADAQRRVLMEHGRLGRQFAQQGLARDIRLACQGIDAHDNDFVIGLVGRQLAPLSCLVQTMRRTEQTRQHLASLGPFFIGYAIARHKPSDADGK